MAIYRDRDKWRADIFLSGLKACSRGGFRTKAEAKDWHDKERERRKAEPPVKAVTFDDCLDRFQRFHLPTLKPRSRSRYEMEIRLRIAREFRFRNVSQITPELQEAWKLRLTETLGPRSANTCLHTFRAILNRAVQYRLIKESPYALESVRIPKEAYRWWDTMEVIHRFLAAAKGTRYYVAYLLALETGMRYGEVVGLWKGDIDFDAGRILVQRQWHQELMDYGPLKDAEPRFIDFNPEGELATELRRQVEGSPDPNVVFVTRTGRHPTHSKLAGKLFYGIQKRAGVPRIWFHELRDTFASWYMIKHDNVWALKEILGHSDVKTTMRYAHHSKTRRQKPLNLAAAVTRGSPAKPKLTAVST